MHRHIETYIYIHFNVLIFIIMYRFILAQQLLKYSYIYTHIFIHTPIYKVYLYICVCVCEYLNN